MNEIELRKYCLDKSIEILSWYKNFFPKKELHPLIISEIRRFFIATSQLGKQSILNYPTHVGNDTAILN